MEQKPPRLMTPFDSLITPPGLYTLKLLLPYTPPSAQHFLAVYIKFAELSYTMEHFRRFPPSGTLQRTESLYEPGRAGKSRTNGDHDEYDGNDAARRCRRFYAGFYEGRV